MEKWEDLNLKYETASREVYGIIRIRPGATFGVLDTRKAELNWALNDAARLVKRNVMGGA